MISNIELFYEPRKILQSLSAKEQGSEMSDRQTAFLCGLIKKFRPKKILEIGVAAGGTTAIMLNCISMLELDTKVVSVDLFSDYYRDATKKVGYLAEECKDILNTKQEYTLYTGKLVAELLDKLDGDIDFVVLDTMHSLPGELLDFLAVFPLLKQGCVVVLHDIILNHRKDSAAQFAAKILFDTVVADKFLDIDQEGRLSNIGAFVITEDTGKYIENIFSALTITWKYLPDDKSLNLYRECYRKYYTENETRLYDMAVNLNKETVHNCIFAERARMIKIYKWLENMRFKKVYMYGCGKFGRQFYTILDQCGIELGGYIISDGQELSAGEERVMYLSDITLDKSKDIIFVGVRPALWPEICARLQERGICEYILPIDEIFELIDLHEKG